MIADLRVGGGKGWGRCDRRFNGRRIGTEVIVDLGVDQDNGAGIADLRVDGEGRLE